MQNPYDFRTPVHNPGRLAGRDQELAQIDACLEASKAGTPVHVALVGERAAGKTSLLNATAERCRQHALVPVRLDLDEGVVASQVTFFQALFDATLDGLIRCACLSADDIRVRNWRQRVYYGDRSLGEPDFLLMGGLVAATYNGAKIADVAPSLLHSDFRTLSSIATESGSSGVTLLIDEGDLLGTKGPLIQKLRNVFQYPTGWSMVISGTQYMFDEITHVFSPIPRQFVRVEVAPFDSMAQTMECIQKPVLPRQVFTRELADVYAITGGRPYEINLLCHFMWEERQELQRIVRLRLTDGVLDKVLSELARIGRASTDAISQIEAIRRLEDDDFEALADLFQLQDLTVEQVALTRLAPQVFTQSQLEAETAAVRGDLRALEAVGVAESDDVRFHIRGDSMVRAYIKYGHARRHADHPIGRPKTFAWLILDTFLPSLISDLPDQRERPSEVRQRFPFGSPRTESAADRFLRCAKSDDLIGVYDSPLLPGMYWQDEHTNDEIVIHQRPDLALPDDAILFRLTASVALETVEYSQLVFSADPADCQAVRNRVEEWVVEHQPLLSKYEATVLDYLVEPVPRVFVERSVLYRDNAVYDRYSSQIHRLFKPDPLAALAVANEGIELLRSQIRPGRTVSQIRDLNRGLGDLLNRAGFILATLGRFEEALGMLRNAVETGRDERWLRLYNIGYVYLQQGEVLASRDYLTKSAQEFAGIGEGWKAETMVMLLYVDSQPSEPAPVSYHVPRDDIAPLLQYSLWALEVLSRPKDSRDVLAAARNSGERLSPAAALVLARAALVQREFDFAEELLNAGLSMTSAQRHYGGGGWEISDLDKDTFKEGVLGLEPEERDSDAYEQTQAMLMRGLEFLAASRDTDVTLSEEVADN